jgi:hypothetical protein
MNNSIIAATSVSQVINLLEAKTGFKKNSISYELQDASRHLLISISIDGLPRRFKYEVQL